MSGVPRITWLAQLLLFTVSAVAAFGGTGLALRGVVGSPVAVVDSGATPTPTPQSAPVLAVPPTVPPTAAPTPTPTEAAQPITIAFGGDVHGEPPIDRVLADGENPFAGVQASLERADLAVINLETAIGSSGTPAAKTYTFQADPALADRAAEAGVDIVNMANNHGMDYGIAGADETKQLAEAAGLATLGYGQDADEAYAAHVVELKGQTVAFVGLTRVLPVLEWGATDSRAGMASAYDQARAVRAVADAAEQADHVVVTIHWGQERATCAGDTQVQLARALVGAGADVIVGHHPHVLQGVVAIDDALVAYSVGNFVFYATRSVQRETGVLTVQLSPDGVDGYAWEPARISGGVPEAVESNADVPDSAGDPSPEDEAVPEDSSSGDAGGDDQPATTPTTSPQPGGPSAGADDGGADGPASRPTTSPTGTPTTGPTESPTTGATDAPGTDPTQSPTEDPDGEPGDASPTEPASEGPGQSEPTAEPTIPSPIQDPDPTSAPAEEPAEEPAAGESGGGEDAARSLRRATPAASPLPPLLQPNAAATGCATDLINTQ